MAYWWVSQNKTYIHERDGEFLWAPKLDTAGRSQHHWTSMTEIQPGDVVFSAVKQKIVAVSVANSAAYDAPRPSGFKDELWEANGWKVDLRFQELDHPVKIADMLTELQPKLPLSRSPLTVKGTGVQGYLFALPPLAGQFILASVDHLAGINTSPTSDEEIAAGIKILNLPETQKSSLVQSRIGQGPYRDNLLVYWEERCAVTELDLTRLLCASHIKPWRDSNNAERLDLYNGLLLSPAYDAAFDKGYITFGIDGVMQVSPQLSDNQLSALGIVKGVALRKIEDAHRAYLAYHNEHIFKSSTSNL
jgi:putative restriction endonuclease